MVWKHRYVFFSFDNGKQQYVYETPSFDRGFTGPGDIFASLLMASIVKTPNDYYKIASYTVNATYAIIKRTYELGFRELALHKSIDLIINPPEEFKPLDLQALLNLKPEEL